MKRKITITALIAASLVASMAYFAASDVEKSEMQLKREKHEFFLANSPYKDTKNLSKKERKALGLPPNAYNERLWELTMNPTLGYPTPFLADPIDISASLAKGSPGSASSPWIERGPRNVGGRTRVVFYDLNDVGANNGDGVDYNRVFAGGVGGGLWVNDNIESSSSSWKIIPGLAANLNVSSYAIDPNNPQVIYIGTGEQYTDGAAVGDGLYRSLDGGTSWNRVNLPLPGGGNFGDDNNFFKSGIFYINDILFRTDKGNNEIYVAIGASTYSSPNFNISNPLNFLGAQNAGLYRSADNGQTWSRVENRLLQFNVNGATFPIIPNDLELNADNVLYFGSIDTPGLNQGGGRIYSSTDGQDWRIKRILGTGDRVEIAPSSTNPNKFYVLLQIPGGVELYSTEDDFSSILETVEPDDVDLGIPAEDFTRGQAFYDLVIETDPLDDSIVYVGGINTHRSRTSGDSWSQLSKWSNNPNMNNLNVPFVHADIHAITFHPEDSNMGLIGSDGGVSLVESFGIGSSSTLVINNRNFDYNVTQFYYGDISQIDFDNGGDFIAGSQDNGTQIFNNSTTNRLTFTSDPSGGDGSYSAIDAEDGYAILGYTSRNHFYIPWPIGSGDRLFNLLNTGEAYEISDEPDGDFINVAELDKTFNILYANSRTVGGSTSITACELGGSSADCDELTGSAISNSRPTAMSASPFQQERPTLFVGTESSRLLKIENANSNSTKIVTNISGDDFLGSVSDIAFGASEDELYVTFHNYGVNNVWYTNDGGATWAQKDGNLPDIPVKAILQNPLVSNEVIIGTELGIFSTDDFDSASPTWTPSINGMTNVKVLDLDLRTSDNTVLATTHGRGLFTGKFDATTASIGTAETPDLVRVFPTQASSIINISSDQSFNDATLSIYNLNGQRVLTDKRSLGINTEQLNIEALSTGFYLLKIKGQGIDQTTKFLKE